MFRNEIIKYSFLNCFGYGAFDCYPSSKTRGFIIIIIKKSVRTSVLIIPRYRAGPYYYNNILITRDLSQSAGVLRGGRIVFDWNSFPLFRHNILTLGALTK